MSMFNTYILQTFDDYVISNQDPSSLRLLDLECKHILNLNNKNQIFVNLAEKVDYKWVVFGSHRGLPEKDRVAYELERIKGMAKSENERAVRIVKTSNGKYFADNTHWVIAYLQRFGENAKLKDIPFYLVDFCHDVPLIVDVNNSVIENKEDIERAVNAAGDIEERIKCGWRPKNITYTIGQFVREIRESML